MGKYSSDSDSDRNTRKSRKDKKSSRRGYSRSRSSASSDSSNSHSRQSHSQYRSRRQGSSERHRSGKVRHGKSRHDNKKTRHRRSHSRSRSGSRSYITEFTSTTRRSSSNSSNSTSSYKKSSKEVPSKQTSLLRSKIADIEALTNLQKQTVELDVVSKPDIEVLHELNDNSFEPKEFVSKSNDTIVIDLHKQTIKVPQAEAKKCEADNIFHHNLFQPEEVRIVKWLKELYSYRHRALQTGGNKT